MEWRYQGKFVDRSPAIRAAGAPLKKCDELSDCLKIYPVDDVIETVLTEAGLHKVPLDNPPQRMVNTRHVGIYTGARNALRPPDETRYQTLLRDLQETTWPSYWTRELGRASGPIGALPPKVDSDFVFGVTRNVDKPTGEELMNPTDVTQYELLFDEAEHHHLYTRTHNDYFPKEKVCRNYGPFDKGQRFGSQPKRRAVAECSLKWGEDTPVEMANTILADHIERNHTKLGTALAPNGNINNVEVGHRFGKKSARDFNALADLVHPNARTSLFRKDFKDWLSSLHLLRNTYRRRNADFRAVFACCKYADVDDEKWLDYDVFKRVLSDYHLHYSDEEILPLAACFGVYRDQRVDYGGMLNLLDIKVELPSLSDFEDSDYKSEFMTTSQFEACMAPYKDNSRDPPAGLAYPQTGIKALISPSIYSNYGLTYVDLKAPRDAGYLKTLYTRLGYEFPDDAFEKLWKLGQEIDNNEKVSVETFKNLMDQAAPITIKDEPEDVCFRGARKKKCP